MPRRCENGWIQTYLDYTSKQQSPTCFHIWVAIGIISAVLGRKVWMPSSGSQVEEGYYNLYPNLYLVLVSPSGVGNKGTALTLGVDILDKSKIPINILRGKITPTRLVTRLQSASLLVGSGDAELFVLSREFKVFTKGIIKDSSLIEDLTDIYDNNVFDYDTEHSVQQSIQRPCVGILAASTPEWLGGGGSSDLMSGGFGARILPIAVTRDEKEIAWATKSPKESALEPLLISDLKEISEMQGEMYVTPSAREFFEKWYMRRKELRRIHDSRLDGYYSKKHDQLRKLSMVLSASMSGDKVVDKLHMQTALALLDENEKNLLFAYSGAAANIDSQWRDAVLTKIEELGDVSHGVLSQCFYHKMGTKKLREVLYELEADHLIEKRVEATKSRPVTYYKFVGEAE